MKTRSRYLIMMCVVASASLGWRTVALSATLVSEGHAAGAQCSASGVNNSGVVVGACIPASGTGAVTPWVSTAVGTETPLTPLTAGQDCESNGIANNGTIVGGCKNGSDDSYAVTWSAGAPGNPPTVLNPFPAGLLGLLPPGDVSSTATGFDQNGNVIGASVSIKGDTTAAIWLGGSSTATPVSNLYDNCVAVDVNNTTVNGAPSIALDCPNQSVKGTVTAKIAQYTGLLGGYVATPLPIPAGYSFCSISEINDALQAVGTCHTAAPDHPETAFWPSPATSPMLLTSLSGNPYNGGGHINNARSSTLTQVTFGYQTNNGQHGAGVWMPLSGGAVSIIPAESGAQSIFASGLADNGVVLVNGENGAQYAQAGIWTSTGGLNVIPEFGGGQNDGLAVISRNGGFAVGAAENGSENWNAVVTTLP